MDSETERLIGSQIEARERAWVRSSEVVTVGLAEELGSEKLGEGKPVTEDLKDEDNGKEIEILIEREAQPAVTEGEAQGGAVGAEDERLTLKEKEERGIETLPLMKRRRGRPSGQMTEERRRRLEKSLAEGRKPLPTDPKDLERLIMSLITVADLRGMLRKAKVVARRGDPKPLLAILGAFKEEKKNPSMALLAGKGSNVHLHVWLPRKGSYDCDYVGEEIKEAIVSQGQDQDAGILEETVIGNPHPPELPTAG